MSFPSEIRDEIALFLADTRHRPAPRPKSHDKPNNEESSNEKLNHEEPRRVAARESPLRRFPRRGVDPDAVDLLNLRVVSRGWHKTATALLREHCWWPIKFDYLTSLARAEDACRKGDVVAGIGKLDLTKIWDVLTFRRVFKGQFYPGPLCPGFIERPQYKNGFLPREDGRELEMHYDKTAEHRLLRGLFDKLVRVYGLSIAFPRAKYDGLEHDWVQCYDTVALDEIAATVQYGLASPAFEHLVQLRLAVPCTFDVHRFTHTMTSEARGRLLHLAIEIKDDTDEDGHDRIDIPGADVEASVLDRVVSSVTIPPSNLQQKFPNTPYQHNLWDFVASCPNLESLSISATHFLDLDQLRWPKPSQSRGLRSLILKRLFTSVPSIIELLRPHPDSQGSAQLLRPHPDSQGSAQLRLLELDNVGVYADGGNWSDLFAYLRSDCPDLAFVNVDQLTYFDEHRNFQLINVEYERYPGMVVTSSQEDLHGLVDLSRAVNCKASDKGWYTANIEALFEDDDKDQVKDEDEHDKYNKYSEYENFKLR